MEANQAADRAFRSSQYIVGNPSIARSRLALTSRSGTDGFYVGPWLYDDGRQTI